MYNDMQYTDSISYSLDLAYKPAFENQIVVVGNQNKMAKPITMLVPTLCDCFSSSTFPHDSGNLQSWTKVLGHFCRKFLDVFQFFMFY